MTVVGEPVTAYGGPPTARHAAVDAPFSLGFGEAAPHLETPPELRPGRRDRCGAAAVSGRVAHVPRRASFKAR